LTPEEPTLRTRLPGPLPTLAALSYLASTIVRAWYVLYAHHPRHHVVSDVGPLLALGERLITAPASQTLADTIWPPGTSAVLGSFMALDPSLGLAAGAQVALGALVPLLVADMTRVMLGRRAGLVALVCASLHFGLIHYGGLFLSEQLFQVAVAVASWTSLVTLHLVDPTADGLRAPPRRARVAGAGAACGAAWALAATFRPNALPVALGAGAALAVHALRGRRRPLLEALGAGLLAFALALAPLAARCTALKGGFCPVSSNLVMNMALGQSGELSGLTFAPSAGDLPTTTWVPPSLLQHGYGGIGTVPASIYDTSGVLRWLGGRLAAEPGRFALRAVGNMLDLFRLEYWPDDDGVGAERLITVAKQLFFLGVMAPALVALAAAIRATWRSRRLPSPWCFVLAVVGAVLGTAALSMGEARYRLPFDGVFILCAASLVGEAGGRRDHADARAAPAPDRSRPPWRRLAAVGIGAFAAVAGVGIASRTGGHALGALSHLVEGHRDAAPDAVARPAADFAAPRAAGTAWDAPGNFVFACAPGCGELRLGLPLLTRARAVEASFDNNDRYQIVFYSGRTSVARANVDARSTSPGLRVETIDVPEAARAGFDSVAVRPLYGDGSYSVGHLRLLGAVN
jgi:hypothetical protein